jgi:hypothetical protein
VVARAGAVASVNDSAWKKQLNHEEHGPRRKTGEAWFLSSHPAGELHWHNNVLFLFVLFMNFVVN